LPLFDDTSLNDKVSLIFKALLPERFAPKLSFALKVLRLNLKYEVEEILVARIEIMSLSQNQFYLRINKNYQSYFLDPKLD
jgi:hypothetical protein